MGWEGLYEVSHHGRVRALDRPEAMPPSRRHPDGWTRIRPGRVLKPGRKSTTDGKSSHLTVALCRDAQYRSYGVHVLVLEAFVGPRPAGLWALHWDDDPLNNHLSNLRWGTVSDNWRDAVRNGRHYNARKTHCKRGHEFTPENTDVLKSGSRRCRACRRMLAR